MDAVAAVPASDDTFPKLLLHNAKVRGDRPAMREKDLGIWQTWTWANVLDEVRAFAVGFSALGISRGDKIAIVGQNRPRLYWAICSAQSLGAVPVPLYADSVAGEMASVLEHAEIAAASWRTRNRSTSSFRSPGGCRGCGRSSTTRSGACAATIRAHLHAFEAVRRRDGSVSPSPEAEAGWLASIAAQRGSDLAVLLYTSGTTGRPKGVMLYVENLVVSARNGNAFDGLAKPKKRSPICRWPGSAITSSPTHSPMRPAIA